MDTYSAITSWAIFGCGVGALTYYYWPQAQHRPEKTRESVQPPVGERKRRKEQEGKPRSTTQPSPEHDQSYADAVKTNVETSKTSGSEPTKKRKAEKKPRAQVQAAPPPPVQEDEPEETDMRTRQFAQQMLQARKGADLSNPAGKEQRVRTVKQNSAMTSSMTSDPAGTGQDADDMSTATPQPVSAGDVSDMLEPTAPGPNTLRVIGSTKPEKEKANRQSKEEVVETKKQRQNRKKTEERKLQRESEEKERKALEEKQRRAARESRGEPAKNGIPASKPTTNNVWTAPNSAPVNEAPAVNGTHTAPLLDTFDAESTSSSNGGHGGSTAATSTTEGGAVHGDNDIPSEEDQMAQAMKQSTDESGWTTVAVPTKKQKKKAADGDATPNTETYVEAKKAVPAAKPTTNGKPKGFQALEVQYEQRSDADPSDPDNWDA